MPDREMRKCTHIKILLGLLGINVLYLFHSSKDLRKGQNKQARAVRLNKLLIVWKPKM